MVHTQHRTYEYMHMCKVHDEAQAQTRLYLQEQEHKWKGEFKKEVHTPTHCRILKPIEPPVYLQ